MPRLLLSTALTIWSLTSLASSSSLLPIQSRDTSFESPTVSLKNGSYYGVHSESYNQDFFLGMPFAQPPLQGLRFANPESLDGTWAGALPATEYAFVSVPDGKSFEGRRARFKEDSIADFCRVCGNRHVWDTEVIRSAISRVRIVFT